GASAAAVAAGEHLGRVGLARSGATGLEDVDLVPTAVAHVLDPAGVADHRVVAPVVGGEVALLVGGQHAVVQGHVQHRDVLDVDDRIQLLLGGGRPDVSVVPVPHATVAVVPAVGDVPVDREIPDAGHPAGVAAGQPVDDVDVVGALLQQQAGGPGPLGVPVLEVEVTAGADEVSAPDRAHPADATGVDDLLHLPD